MMLVDSPLNRFSSLVILGLRSGQGPGFQGLRGVSSFGGEGYQGMVHHSDTIGGLGGWVGGWDGWFKGPSLAPMKSLPPP